MDHKKLIHKRKGKSSSTFKTALPSKRSKVSNRPRYSPSASEDEADDPEHEEAERAAMLAALERHQAEFLQGAVPGASTAVKGKQKAKTEVPVTKSVWELELDDFDDEEAGTEDSDEEDEDISHNNPRGRPAASTSKVAVVAFEEPRLSSIGASSGGGDMRSFMSSKVKNARKEFSVADLANAKPGRKPRKTDEGDVDAEQESHLSALDAHLSTLIRPLTSATGSTHSQLPSLLSSLPVAPTKVLKGHTPLPSNAPRTLRRGQAAANLKRAKSRDEAAGILEGQKGREAKSLKEKRVEEGNDKRERGMKGAIGKMMKGGLKLSKEDIARGSGKFKGIKSGRGGAKRGKSGKRRTSIKF